MPMADSGTNPDDFADCLPNLIGRLFVKTGPWLPDGYCLRGRQLDLPGCSHQGGSHATCTHVDPNVIRSHRHECDDTYAKQRSTILLVSFCSKGFIRCLDKKG